MTRLTGHCFGKYSNEPLFGLRCGQRLNNAIMYDARWHNKTGTEMGFGDLSLDNLETIALSLEEDELFLILPTSASFLAPDSDVRYVAQNAIYVITPCEVYFISLMGDSDYLPGPTLRDRAGKVIETKYLRRTTLFDMLTVDIKSTATNPK